MTRPAKKQINIKMPQPLIEALKTRAENENITFTDTIIQLCEQGLGIGISNPKSTASRVEPAQLDERIANQLANQIAPLHGRLVALETSMGKLWV